MNTHEHEVVVLENGDRYCMVCAKVVEKGTELRLGDRFANYLETKWGITEEGYRAFKKFLGLPPTCNCRKRKDWLNTVPKAYKEGGLAAAKAAIADWHERWDKPR